MKCAQRAGKKGVVAILGEMVCAKCSEALERKALIRSRIYAPVCDPSLKLLGARKRAQTMENAGVGRAGVERQG